METDYTAEDLEVIVDELRRLGYRIYPPVMTEGTNAVE